MSCHRKRLTGARVAGSVLLASVVFCFSAGCTSSNQSAESSAQATGSAQAADSAQATDSAQDNGSVPAPDTTSETIGSSMPDVSIPSAATTPVPQPQPGDINQTVAEVPVTTLPAAAVTETADLGTGVSVEVLDVKPVTGTARGPGEVGGPAAAVTIRITNSSPAAVPLNEVEITAQDNAGTPAGTLSGDPAAPLTGQLAAGQTANGVYVFSLGASHQNPLKLSISYAAGSPVALYTADVSN